MGKISNCINMLKLLSNGKKMTIKELSEMLEVSPRMIKSYKQDLEYAGYYIETISGRYGGYVINNQELRNFDKVLSIRDLQLLEKLQSIVLKSLSFAERVNYIGLLERLRNTMIYTQKIEKYKNKPNENISIDIFYYAIKKQIKLNIKYDKNNKIFEKFFFTSICFII